MRSAEHVSASNRMKKVRQFVTVGELSCDCDERDCCAIRIGSFVPFAHTSESGSYRLSILFARRFHRSQETRLIPCVHSQTRMLLDPGRTVHTSPWPWAHPFLFVCPYFACSFAKRRDLRGMATALGCGRTMGTCMRCDSCCSPSLSLARNMRVHTFWELLFRRLLASSLLRRSRGTPEVQPHIRNLSWPRARARVRMFAVVRFYFNRNNGKRV